MMEAGTKGDRERGGNGERDLPFSVGLPLTSSATHARRFIVNHFHPFLCDSHREALFLVTIALTVVFARHVWQLLASFATAFGRERAFVHVLKSRLFMTPRDMHTEVTDLAIA